MIALLIALLRDFGSCIYREEADIARAVSASLKTQPSPPPVVEAPPAVASTQDFPTLGGKAPAPNVSSPGSSRATHARRAGGGMKLSHSSEDFPGLSSAASSNPVRGCI